MLEHFLSREIIDHEGSLQWPLRIKDLRAKKGIGQVELGRLIKVTQGAVSSWERGEKEPTADSYMRLAELCSEDDDAKFFVDRAGRVLGVSPMADEFRKKTWPKLFVTVDEQRDEIRELKEELKQARNASEIEGLSIPLLKGAVAAGDPREINEKEIDSYLLVPKQWLPRGGGRVVALKVRGNSMSPIIEEGYIVLIDISQRDPKNLVRKMVAVREGDGVTIKWLRADGPHLLLVPQHTSPDIPVRVLSSEGDFGVVGRVVRWIGEPPKK